VQQGVEPAGNTHQLRRESPVGFGGVLATLGTPRPTLCPPHFAFLGCRFGLASRFLGFATYHLLDADRERAPLLEADQGQHEEGQPGHRLAIQTGKEPIETMGGLASFGDDDFITHEQVDLLRPIHVVPEEHPKQHGPRYHRCEKALHSTVTPAFARPAGHAEHRDASCHHQESAHYPAALAQGGCWYGGLKALQEC